MIRKLLLVSVLGLIIHAFVIGLSASFMSEPRSTEIQTFLGSSPQVSLPIAFVAAFLGTISICLPSFYFYTQLAGIDASFRLVTAQALRAHFERWRGAPYLRKSAPNHPSDGVTASEAVLMHLPQANYLMEGRIGQSAAGF